MEQLTDTSIIFYVARGLQHWFRASLTYKFICIILVWCKNSQINRFLGWYLGRNSSLKYSLIYRIFSGVFRFFDGLWDKLCRFAVRCGKSSFTVLFIRDSFGSPNCFAAAVIIILFFSIGFGATNLLLGTFNAMKAVLTVTGIAVSLLLLPGRARWKACLESSIFWRFAKYIFD
jgi:hypothetical protein